MRRGDYPRFSPLRALLEWLVTLVLVVWLVRLALDYLDQHLGIVIGVALLAIGGIIGYRIYDYKKHTWL